MTYNEIIERGFSINQRGLVFDDAGNEYRNEDGCIEFIDTTGVNKKQLQNITNDYDS